MTRRYFGDLRAQRRSVKKVLLSTLLIATLGAVAVVTHVFYGTTDVTQTHESESAPEDAIAQFWRISSRGYERGWRQVGAENELTHHEEDGPIKDEQYQRVNRYIAQRYAGNRVSDACYPVQIADQQHELYCLELSSVKKVDQSLYVVLAGQLLDKDMKPTGAHVDSGLLQFLKFNDADKQLSLEAESELIPSGVFGSPNKSTRLVKINHSGTLAWITYFGDIHMGYAGGGISLYAPVNHSITPVLDLASNADNSGACQDQDACEISHTQVVASLVPQGEKGFYPIKVNIKRYQGKLNDLHKTESNLTIRYSEKKHQYIVPRWYGDWFSEF